MAARIRRPVLLCPFLWNHFFNLFMLLGLDSSWQVLQVFLRDKLVGYICEYILTQKVTKVNNSICGICCYSVAYRDSIFPHGKKIPKADQRPLWVFSIFQERSICARFARATIWVRMPERSAPRSAFALVFAEQTPTILGQRRSASSGI